MKKNILTILIALLFTVVSSAQEKSCTILISFDGFRWDYLNRNLTPNIQSLINNGVRASSLKPVFPSKTFPNHLSIVTGQYAENHGIIQNDFIDTKANRRYKINDSVEVRDSRWYTGEAIWETARKHGKITASYFWPGSEIIDSLRHPNYFEKYDHSRPYGKRIEGILQWLELPKDKRPDLITVYFDAADTKGHSFGPNSPEVEKAISELDNLIGSTVANLKQKQLLDSANIIIVSDHGMAEIDLQRTIVIEELLREEKYLAQWNGPVMLVESLEKRNNEIVSVLRKNLSHAKVYLKNEIPEYFHFKNNEMISGIVIVAELGWYLTNKKLTLKDSLNFGKGNHGFDHNQMDMHGIFVAAGPAFKKNYNTGTIENIDIYPLLCSILNIPPHKNIDSRLGKIEYILK